MKCVCLYTLTTLYNYEMCLSIHLNYLVKLWNVQNNNTGGSDLNNFNHLNLAPSLANYLGPNTDSNPYIDININSNYYDPREFIDRFRNQNLPLIINFNIQSLHSKFEALKNFFSEISREGISIIAITLQEIWKISNEDVLRINGFTFYFAERKRSRGGGYLHFKWSIPFH